MDRLIEIREFACKSLARPGRKQSTAIKLWIYSTYFSGSSLQFFVHCSISSKPLKKNSEYCPSNQVSGKQWIPLGTKNGDLSVAFSVQGNGGTPTGPDPENNLGGQEFVTQGRPVYCGLQLSCEQRQSCESTRQT